MWEYDPDSKDDLIGEFTVSDTDQAGTVAIKLDGASANVDFNYSVTRTPSDPNFVINTDIADSLGDMVAVGIPNATRVDRYQEITRQVDDYSGTGTITDLAVTPDGKAIYATSDAGELYGIPFVSSGFSFDSVNEVQLNSFKVERGTSPR